MRSQAEVQSMGASSSRSTSMPARNQSQLAHLQRPDPEPRRPRVADEAQQQQQRTKTGGETSTFSNNQHPKTRGEANRESRWVVSPTMEEKEMVHGRVEPRGRGKIGHGWVEARGEWEDRPWPWRREPRGASLAFGWELCYLRPL